jgi:hypothetical protein
MYDGLHVYRVKAYPVLQFYDLYAVYDVNDHSYAYSYYYVHSYMTFFLYRNYMSITITQMYTRRRRYNMLL